MLKRVQLLVLLSLLSACAVGPDYKRPEVDLPATWRVEIKDASSIADVSWWEEFHDPELTQLITTALQNNNDLRIAAARVERYFALYGIARSNFFPQVNSDASYARQRFSKQTLPETGDLMNGTERDYYVAEGTLSWEIDLWGKIRRSTEAARADIMSQEAARRGVILTVVTNVAIEYATLRDLDQRLAIAKSTLESRRHSLQLAQDRVNAGTASELDLRQAESDMYAVQASIAPLEFQIAQSENLLSILVGSNPGPIRRGKPIGALMPTGAIPVSLPSSLIDQRPDVIQAEEALRGANARIGVAKAAFFPSLSLTGLFGFVSTDLSEWIRSDSRQWQYGPNVSLPIFNAGKIGNQVRVAEADTEQAVANYKAVILNALREVENALIGFQKTRQQIDAQTKQVGALQQYLQLSQQRYDEGQSSYLEVLDAQRNLFSAQLGLAQTEGLQVGLYIGLFRALGGGWVGQADKLTVEPKRETSWIF
ncbi:MAG: efflux transporter outer membrane subunit [Deltaproteobacteria bacterium]|nr:efflux transporter outer membrane subunit [Deltaproteobacteria bacterium]